MCLLFNLITPSSFPLFRTTVLLKAENRVEVVESWRHPSLGFCFANLASYDDEEEREKVTSTTLQGLPELVDDDSTTTDKITGQEGKKEQQQQEETIYEVFQATGNEAMREALAAVEAFRVQFTYNSMWKVIKQKLSSEDPPTDDPHALRQLKPLGSFVVIIAFPSADFCYLVVFGWQLLFHLSWAILKGYLC